MLIFQNTEKLISLHMHFIHFFNNLKNCCFITAVSGQFMFKTGQFMFKTGQFMFKTGQFMFKTVHFLANQASVGKMKFFG